jgi:hypothetical protein
MSRLVEIIIDAIRTGVGTGLDHGIGLGIGTFILVILYHFRQESDQQKPYNTTASKRLITPNRQEENKESSSLVEYLFVIGLVIFLLIYFLIY